MSLAVFAQQAQAIQIDKISKDVLRVSGVVEKEDVEKFRAFPTPKVVIFGDSPGGSLSGGIGIGATIRDRGIKTIIDGVCYSACALMAIAGTMVGITDKGDLGFHAAIYADSKEIAADGIAFVGAYMSDLGYPPKFIMAVHSNGVNFIIITAKQAVFVWREYGVAFYPLYTKNDVDSFVGKH